MGQKLVSLTLLAIACFVDCRAQMPSGFTWVNIESDQKTMAKVRSALQGLPISAIREVGVEGEYALVMTTFREDGVPTPAYDLWSIYNISLKTGHRQVLANGYGVKLLDWIGSEHTELAITYYDCWECEPGTLFTTFWYKQGVGWRARWADKQNSEYPRPGATVLVTDAGAPYDDNEIDQVFAVVSRPHDSFAAGSWFHARDVKTGKIVADDVYRYSIDAQTKEDTVTQLTGPGALAWKRKICSRSEVIVQPSLGQSSRACKDLLRTGRGK